MSDERPRGDAGPQHVRDTARAPEPGPHTGDAGPRRVRGAARAATLGERTGGPWRIAVADPSMRPAIEPGDWLLVDPTTRHWPRRGSIVVFREPDDGMLAVKRVAARPGDWVPFADGWLRMADDEAWLLGDASDTDVEAAGAGRPVDSRRYGPVPVELLVGRAWLRYGPPGRPLGLLPPGPTDLLARGRTALAGTPASRPELAGTPMPEPAPAHGPARTLGDAPPQADPA
jgi:hypothetical protein